MKNDFVAGIGAAMALFGPSLFGSIPWHIVAVMILAGLVIWIFYFWED